MSNLTLTRKSQAEMLSGLLQSAIVRGNQEGADILTCCSETANAAIAGAQATLISGELSAVFPKAVSTEDLNWLTGLTQVDLANYLVDCFSTGAHLDR